MARSAPHDRLEKIIAVAAESFVDRGYQRTQMDDIANRLQVAKGTLYRHVESKEALFAAVVTYGDRPDLLPTDGMLAPVSMAQLVKEVIATARRITDGLDLRMAAAHHSDLADAVEHLAVEMYRYCSQRRVAIMVLDRCASELAPDWFDVTLHTVVESWAALLEPHRAHLPAGVDPTTLARTIVELVTLWAVRMPWEASHGMRSPVVSAAVVGSMTRSLVVGTGS